MSKHLFLFSIGPVQSFIEQARKSRDLFTGSLFISDLIKDAMEKLKGIDNNAEFIYPYFDSSYMPNQFLVIINVEDPAKTGAKLENLVVEKFKTLSGELLKQRTNSNLTDKFYESYNKQLQNFLRINWISIPYSDKEFKEDYTKIQKYLKGIKNLNSFEQFVQKPGKKCHLCGERNSLFFSSNNNTFGLNKKNIGAISLNITAPMLDSNEGLCAVCFTKRFYKSKNHFPSTAKIALSHTLEKVTDKKMLDNYKQIFFNNFDEQLLYEENLNEYYFKKNNLNSLINKLDKIKKAQREINDSLKEENLKLTKYYALIKLDGDNMGKWLSGKFLNDEISSGELKEFDVQLSKNVSEYAKKMEKYFSDKSIGKIIYAGGDDLLAFVNLNYLTSALRHIREKFPRFQEIKVNDIVVVKDGEESTASCGVVIAHYKTPLSEVLKWTRKMEHEAKEKSGKDACAIAVLKHSGEINKSVFKWKYEKKPEELWTTNLMGELTDALNNYLSGSYISNLNQEFRLLIDKNGYYSEDAIIANELNRLILRSNRDPKDKSKKQKLNELAERLIQYYVSSDNLGNFISLLNITRFISREVSYAV
ncbi:MAG: type III-B CRISPR-associated protein Cas10/Cmr2 [bacterium]